MIFVMKRIDPIKCSLIYVNASWLFWYVLSKVFLHCYCSLFHDHYRMNDYCWIEAYIYQTMIDYILGLQVPSDVAYHSHSLLLDDVSFEV